VVPRPRGSEFEIYKSSFVLTGILNIHFAFYIKIKFLKLTYITLQEAWFEYKQPFNFNKIKKKKKIVRNILTFFLILEAMWKEF